MDFQELDKRVMELLTSWQFEQAEAELQRLRLEVSEQSDHNTLELVLAELVHLYCIMQPPNLAKAEMYCLERERVSGTGQSKLQTGMMYYWSMHNPERTIAKVQEAVAAARQQEDPVTVYQCLGLLGIALLELDRIDEAAHVLADIEAIVTARKRIVVGDETLFLERFFAKCEDNRTRATIKSIAGTLWPVCRDAQFSARLKVLAEA